MKQQDELVIITKTYDLILWSCKESFFLMRTVSDERIFNQQP